MSPRRVNGQCSDVGTSVLTNANDEKVLPTHVMQTRRGVRVAGLILLGPTYPMNPPKAPIQTQPPQGDVTNVEFKQAMQMLAQIVTSQANRPGATGSNSQVVSEYTQLGNFMRLNPPNFTGTSRVCGGNGENFQSDACQ